MTSEFIYCPECRCLHVDYGVDAKTPHSEHTCERCKHVFKLDHESSGLNIPWVKENERSPYKCWLCHATYRARGSIEEGETPVRNVCVCEVTSMCDTCGAGFVVQRDVFDDNEEPKYRCRACATGVVDPVLMPKARTGPVDMHDIDEHLNYYNTRDKRKLLCVECRKGNTAAKSTIEKTNQGYLFGCPNCGAYELLSTKQPATPAGSKKPSVHWRRVRRPVTSERNE